MLIQESVNAMVQVAIVLLAAFLCWAAFGRKKAGFFGWIGLTPPSAKSMRAALLIFILWSALTTPILLLSGMKEAAAADNTVAGMLRAEGFSAEIVFVILIMAGVKTALSEEIFFRGLIAKRMINAMGFWAGNTLHALIFGAVHLLVFVVPGGPAFTPVLGLAFVLLPGGAGWLMAFLNERKGNGSIAPGWLMHALGNAIAYPLLAFIV